MQPITYSSDSHEVLIRTFYGGGLQGSFSTGPQVSIYGDGTYILGLDRQGQLTTDELQQLLDTLVNTYGLLDFSRQHFSEIQGENATFLELAINGKQKELVYGTFGKDQTNKQEVDEYHRLGKALIAITEALEGTTQPYQGTAVSLLARRTFSPDLSQNIPSWPLSEFTLAQAVAYECGLVPPNETSPNAETACLKFTIPARAILLSPAQAQTLRVRLRGQRGDFSEDGLYYTVILRILLPDEQSKKTLAMFGSAQADYRGVPLLEGNVPPVPTPSWQ